MRATHRNPAGSLLIEVLVSAGLAIAFGAAIATLLVQSSRLVAHSRHEAEATALAKEAMEQVYAMKRSTWDAIKNRPKDKVYRIAPVAGGFFLTEDASGQALGQYTRKITIARAYRQAGKLHATGTEDERARRVAVRVTWKERGKEQAVELATYLADWSAKL